MMTAGDPAAARAEWREGWPIPVVSALALFVSVIHLYSIGAYIPSLEREFGWSRTQISSGLTILSVLSVVCAPFMGAAIDRFGSRRIGLPGLVLYCGAVASLSLATPSIWSWWGLWLLVGAGSLCIKPTVWTAAIASRFSAGRGLAISVALMGVGLGSALFPLVSVALAREVGWRSGYVVMGVLGLVLVGPLLWRWFHDPNDRLRQRGRGGAGVAGLALRPAIASRYFWRLAFVSLAFTVGNTSMIVHFVPILTEGGLAPPLAGALAGLIGAGSMVGRLGTGWLLDRYAAPRIGVIAFALPILVCLLLTLDRGAVLAGSVAFLLGLALGAEVDVVAYLATRCFGLRHFGALFGTMAGLQSLGAGLGPLLAGHLHDRFGSYDALPWTVLPLFALGTAAIATIGAYPTFDATEPT